MERHRLDSLLEVGSKKTLGHQRFAGVPVAATWHVDCAVKTTQPYEEGPHDSTLRFKLLTRHESCLSVQCHALFSAMVAKRRLAMLIRPTSLGALGVLLATVTKYE